MTRINTRDFGEIEVGEESLFEFPNGVFAFEDAKKFALISPLGDDVYPMWLQSAEDVTPCFVVFDPTIIDENYNVSLTHAERTLLNLENDTELRYLVIAKVPNNFRETTVNMKSPIVLNCKSKVAAQFILPHDYTFRLPIYESETSQNSEMSQTSEEGAF